MRRLLLPLALVAVLTGCWGGGGASGSAPRATSVTASRSSTPDPACTPAHRVTITKKVPTVLYSLRFVVPPGGRRTGKQDATLYTYPDIAPGVFVTHPRHDVPDARLTDAVLTEIPQGSPVLDGSRGLAWDIHNHTSRTGRYLVYAGAIVYRGDWSATTCGSGAEHLKGTVVVIGRVRSGQVLCAGPASGDRLHRAARLTACHHDSTSARPFRTPEG